MERKGLTGSVKGDGTTNNPINGAFRFRELLRIREKEHGMEVAVADMANDGRYQSN